MSEGVEWALHCLVALAWAGGERPVSTARLAAAHGLPAAYLNKHLQALSRAGLVASTAGPRGGFRLARPTARITLLDVVVAIEGGEDAFRCQEIRRQGIGADASPSVFRRRCAIAAAMREAEVAWRRELAARTLADVQAAADRAAPQVGRRMHEALLHA